MSYVRKETSHAANIKKAEQTKTARMPFAFLMYRLLVKPVTKKNFLRRDGTRHGFAATGERFIST